MLKREWADGLESLYDGTFPRRCPNCGFPFKSLAALFENTFPDEAHGVHEAEEPGRFPFVEIERRCRCGRRVIEHCADRRDLSRGGRVKRDTFGHRFLMLCQKGIAREKAAFELRKLARGRPSRYLLDKGFNTFGV